MNSLIHPTQVTISTHLFKKNPTKSKLKDMILYFIYYVNAHFYQLTYIPYLYVRLKIRLYQGLSELKKSVLRNSFKFQQLS